MTSRSNYFKPYPNKTELRYDTYYYPFFFAPDYYFASVYSKDRSHKYIPDTEYNYNIEHFNNSNNNVTNTQIVLFIIFALSVFFIML
jgi:hypothetical protein